jgi:hypothetical protein
MLPLSAVGRDDEPIVGDPCLSQQMHMAGMDQIEATVGESDLRPRRRHSVICCSAASSTMSSLATRLRRCSSSAKERLVTTAVPDRETEMPAGSIRVVVGTLDHDLRLDRRDRRVVASKTTRSTEAKMAISMSTIS